MDKSRLCPWFAAGSKTAPDPRPKPPKAPKWGPLRPASKQIASGAPLRISNESSPKISNRKQCPLRFFRVSGPQISKIARGVPLRFSENHLPKSQMAKGVLLRFFSENHLPKSQIASGVPLFFSENQVPKSEMASCVLLRSFNQSNPQISNRKG